MNDFSKCARCQKSLISEEFDKHDCTPQLLGTQDIVIDHYFVGQKDENGDIPIFALSLKGILIRLIMCKHNPPHQPTGNGDIIPTRKQSLFEHREPCTVFYNISYHRIWN